MVVGIARVVLGIDAASSLKQKRHVLRKVIDRVRAKFNVAIAEVADQDIWRRAVLGIVAVGNDRAFIQESLDKVTGFIEEMYVAEIVSREVEIQSFKDFYA